MTDTYEMDAFGVALGGAGATENPYRFGGAWGYLTDPSGMLQLGARYYWPEVGRFVQQDPARDGMNWYAYAEGNPVTAVDALGTSARKARAKARRAQNWGRGVADRLSNSGAIFSGEVDADKMQHCYVACRIARGHPLGKWAGQFTAYWAQLAWEAVGPGPDSDEDTRAANVGAFECGSDRKPGGCPKDRSRSNAKHCEDCCRDKVRSCQY